MPFFHLANQSTELTNSAFLFFSYRTVYHVLPSPPKYILLLFRDKKCLHIVCHNCHTCLSRRAHTEKWCNTVDTCGALVARCSGAVINVLRAVRPTPAIDTHANIAANQIAAGPSILASVRLQAAFIHVFRTVLAYRDAEVKRIGRASENLTCGMLQF